MARVDEPSLRGDAHLDGEFNSDDLVAVMAAGKYERDAMASWSEGDWNGDGRFSSGDLILAFEEGGYERRGPRDVLNAVPEPSSFVMLITCLIGVEILRRIGMQPVDPVCQITEMRI